MKKSVLSTLALAASMATVANAAPLAEGGAKFLGNITTGGQVRSDMATYWNQITAENECKWGSINTAENVYNWSGCDAAYNWAKNNGYHFKFHALVWGSQYPNWITSLSAERTAEVIEKWMKAVADHYNPMGGLEMIDVVNEAIRTGNNQYHSGYTKTKIIQALGGDNGKYTFVANAFKMARKYFPNSILIYNDYNTIRWNIDEGIDLIKQIKDQGAPVDAYGQQAHDISGMSESDFKSALTKIHNQTQLPIYITEYDVGSDDDDYQLASYKAHIPFLWETPWIAGITLCGYVNGSTWINVDAKKADQCKANGGGWQECENNNPCKGCSGLITGSGDRKAMTWLKQYFSQHLADGQNTTGLSGGTTVDPVPQKPFNATNTPWAVPGKIEAEDFDITGAGINDDGTSNISYSDKDSKNQGNSSYRPDATDADIYVKPFGTVIGYNETGEWFEYTIDVKEAGDYTLFAAVASANKTNGFKFSLDGKDLTDELTAPMATTPDSYEEFDKISANVNIAKAGKHVLRLTVTGDWFDIDYFNFVKGKNATDDAPLSSSAATNNSSSSAAISSSTSSASNGNSSASVNSGSSTSVINGSSASIANGSSASVENGSSASVINGSSASITDNPYSSGSTAPVISGTQENPGEAPEAIFGSLHLGKASASTYEVFDLKGQHIARFTANNMAEATQMWKNGLVKNGSNTKGIVLIHNRHSGETVQVKTIR